MSHDTAAWPSIPYASWKETCANLQLRTQIVGKIRLACTPWLNHSWHVTLYPSAAGLTTGPIPVGPRSLEIAFDFLEHRLLIASSDGQRHSLSLKEQPIAEFHDDLMTTLHRMDVPVRIHPVPSEFADPIPFARDRVHRAYDPAAVERFWGALWRSAAVMTRFRTSFLGKSSPVHFFWGSFDLAVTRFSGRLAPRHPGGIPGLPDAVTREAYSHEVCSAGFWPGGNGFDDAAYYCYAYPEPPGFRNASLPAGAYHDGLHEFILPYEQVRASSDPEAMLLGFLQGTYEAAATRGNWDRAALECPLGIARVPRAAPSL
jgi:hypothetical protein